MNGGKIALVVLMLGAAGGGYYYYQRKKSLQSENAQKSIDGSITSILGRSIGDVVTTSTKRGFRNNNPTNIKWASPINWVGQKGKDADGFVIFDTVENGLRAGAMNAKNKIKRGLNTVRKIILDWTSGDDPVVQANYIKTVASRMQRGADDPVTNSDIPRLLDGIVYFENGSQPYTMAQLTQAKVAAGA